MAIKILKQKSQKGYAILFAIIIISAISVVAAGLLSASYKQFILSSLASDSQVAFYQADKGAECALYLDLFESYLENDNFTTWNCGGVSLTVSTQDRIKYTIDPKPGEYDPSDPCFRITITKVDLTTTITSNGYNICSTGGNVRALQRSIYIEHTDE
jgi:hypothetical protein